MPIELADIRRSKRTLEVETAAGDVQIVYRLGEVSEAAIASRPAPGFAGVIELLAQWIESWDVTDGEAAYPITAESLEKLPLTFVMALYDAILGDVRIRPTKTAGSLSGR